MGGYGLRISKKGLRLRKDFDSFGLRLSGCGHRGEGVQDLGASAHSFLRLRVAGGEYLQRVQVCGFSTCTAGAEFVQFFGGEQRAF